MEWAHNLQGPAGPATIRVLRLVAMRLFRPSAYEGHVRVARGAYAQVFRCALPPVGLQPLPSAVLKVMDLPASPADPCLQHDAFTEVAVLEGLRGRVPVTELLDYGVDREALYLVLKDYRCSLRAWRRSQVLGREGAERSARLYVRIFLDVVQAVRQLHAQGVAHFDLKGDNVLLEAAPGCGEDSFWRPGDPRPPFRVVLADFGESCLLPHRDALTVRNRGTEYIKSPEMLLVAHASKKAREGRGGMAGGAGLSSDVWSLGCLLYEVVFGDYLFFDPDWIRFFIRVTQPGQPLLSPERERELSALPPVRDLLLALLQRDPQERPDLDRVVQLTQQTLQQLDRRGYGRPVQRADTHRSDHSADGPEVGTPRDWLKTAPKRPLRQEDLEPLVQLPGGRLEGPARLDASVLLAPLDWAVRRARDLGRDRVRAVALLAPPRVPFGSPLYAKIAALQAVCQPSGISCSLVPLSPLSDFQTSEAGQRNGAQVGGAGSLSEAIPRALRQVRAVCGPRGTGQALIICCPGLEAECAAIAICHVRLHASVSAYEALTQVQLATLTVPLTAAHLTAVEQYEEARERARARGRGRVLLSCPCGMSSGILMRDSTGSTKDCSGALGERGCACDCRSVVQTWAQQGIKARGVSWAQVREDEWEVDPLACIGEMTRATEPGKKQSEWNTAFTRMGWGWGGGGGQARG